MQFWQIEFEETPISGEKVEWNDRIRLRHLITRRYLTLKYVSRVALDHRPLAAEQQRMEKSSR
jgi:hypothetical protein